MIFQQVKNEIEYTKVPNIFYHDKKITNDSVTGFLNFSIYTISKYFKTCLTLYTYASNKNTLVQCLVCTNSKQQRTTQHNDYKMPKQQFTLS